VIAGEKNLRETVEQEGLIFHLIDFTNIIRIPADGDGAGNTGKRSAESSGIP
jgi:hypothetical protein